MPKSLDREIADRAKEEGTSKNKLCISALRAYLAILLVAIFTSTSFSQIQIHLADKVSPFKPIEVGCSCNTVDDEEVHVQFSLFSDNPEYPAYLKPHTAPRMAYLWGHPGWHTLIANVAIINYDYYTITDDEGVKREIKSVKSFRYESAQHRFEIEGRAPPKPDNKPPVADAGEDQTLKTGEQARLEGSRSSDPDGDELSFLWTLTRPAGSSSSIENPTFTSTTFVPDVDGEYVAKLAVDDGEYSSTDQITVTASDVPEGRRWVIWMEESAERTPSDSALHVAIRAKSTASNSDLWIVDKDRQNDWVPQYEQRRQEAGQSLPCLFIVDAATKEQIWLGDAPESVEEYDQIVKEHGG
jgi:hypothetical protein